MKTMQYLSILVVLAILTLINNNLHAQEPEPAQKSQPEIKWDVKKEFDEHGNIIHYDSSYSWTWKHHGFPDPIDCFPFEDMDSLFAHPPFAFGPFRDFMDSFDLDFYLDSSLFHKPFGFRHFQGFPDSLWEESFWFAALSLSTGILQHAYGLCMGNG